MDKIERLVVPLTREFYQNFWKGKFTVDKWLEELYPDFIIMAQKFWINDPSYAEGAIEIQYRKKSESQLYRERFEFMLSNIPFYKSKPDEKVVKFGCCPHCGRYIHNWKPMFGGLAPEWWATMRERGIDPATGHSQTCFNRSFKC